MNQTNVDSEQKSFDFGVTCFSTTQREVEFPQRAGKRENPSKIAIETGIDMMSISAESCSLEGKILKTIKGESINFSQKALAQLADNRKSAITSERWEEVHNKGIEIGD